MPQKTNTHGFEFGNIPQELKQLPQWVLWKREKRNGKPTKVPYQINGRRASHSNPGTWSRYQDIETAYKRGGFDGIGFVFSGNDFYTGIDLDKCRDPESGKIAQWALDIIHQAKSYAEVSPSRTGLKLFIRGDIPDSKGRKKPKYPNPETGPGAVEIYSKDRYFTVTGWKIPGAPGRIAENQASIDKIYKLVFNTPEGSGHKSATIDDRQGHNDVASLDDRELIHKAGTAANGQKFTALWGGNWADAGYGSQSEADLALCSILAFYSGPDPARIDALYRQSGLMRDKWERDEYRIETINKAIQSIKEFYRPGKAGSNGKPEPATADPAGAAGAPGGYPQPEKRDFERLKTQTAADLLSEDIPPINWIIQDILPEGYAVLGGRAKMGKSWKALHLALSVASGGVALGRFKAHRGKVLYIALEDNKRRMQDRINKLIETNPADYTEALRGMNIVYTILPMHEKGEEQLREFIEENNPSLVVIDTLRRFAPINRDASYQADYDNGAALHQIALDYNIALLAIHHTTKAKYDYVIDELSGTTGVTAAVDTALILRNGLESPELHVVGRDVMQETYRMNFDKVTGLWKAEGIADELSITSERQEIIEFLESQERVLTAKEIAELLNRKYDNVRQTLYKMAKDEQIIYDAKEIGRAHV